MKALVKSHAQRALDKRQWICLKKWIQKCQAQQAAAFDLDNRKWNLCITCKWNVKRTQNGRKLQKFFKKKLVKSPEKRTQEFCWFISTKRKAIAKFGKRRRLWKIVVMDFEVFRIDRRLLTSENFEQFRRAFPCICCKSENFVKFACKSILPPSLMAELDRLAKFLSSYKVQVKTSPGSAWYIIPDVQWS